MTDPGLPPGFEDRERVRERIAERMKPVQRTFAVSSGKGGVGKSAVAVNLALALARTGARTGLLDADLHGPSVGRMLGLRSQPVRVSREGLVPAPGPGDLVVQSMDFFLQGAQALDADAPPDAAPLRSAIEDALLADLLGGTAWGELDFLVVDLPPGADRLPAFAGLHPGLAGALAVTIPSEVSLLAVERGLRRAREARVPLVGLVENMGSSVCERCGHEGPLFREARVEKLAAEMDLPLVARIPFDPRLAAAADAGRPFLDVAGRGSPAGRALEGLAAIVARFDAPQVETW